jgi:predicted Zn finger-like uncharacterized protein
MILTCPSCATAFAVAPGTLDEKGRMVRCSKCGQRWHATSIAGQPAAAAPAAPVREAPASPAPAAPVPPAALASEASDATGDHAASAAAPATDEAPLAHPQLPFLTMRQGRRIGLVAWPVLALVVLAAAAAILGRDQIVAMAPGLIPYYRMAGLPLTVESGLEISDLASARATEDGKPVLVVSGEIHNVSGSDRQLPPVRVALLDADRNEIDFGLFDVERRVLPPGGMTRFEVRLVDPPPSAKSFRVTLRDTP